MNPTTFTDRQAQATIEAAHIGAAAAIHAAWIQATSAAGAVAAGALAYIGAVRQVRFQDRAHEVRALAYRFRLTRVVEEHYEQVFRAWAAAEAQPAAFRSGKASAAISSFRLVQPRMLHDENWEAHAMLGRRAVELILLIDDLSQRLAKFDQEIRGEGTRTDSSARRWRSVGRTMHAERSPIRRADRSALRPNSVRTHEPVAGENGFPDLGQRKAPDQREVEAPVPSRCAGRAAAGSCTCRRRTRRKLDGPYRWGRCRHSPASIQATAAAGALAAGALAFIGAVRLARGGLAFSPCRVMGVWR